MPGPAVRTDWVDVVKAVAIVLVVLGHSAGLNDWLRSAIYAFHVPAFLLVTGYLLPRDLGNHAAGALAARLGPLVRLYALFSAAAILILAVQAALAGGPVAGPVLRASAGSLYGVEGPFDGLGHENAPLWYLPMLCVSLAAVCAAARLPRARMTGTLALCGAAAAGVALSGRWWPWYLQFAGIGGLFVWIGWQARPALDRLARSLAHRPRRRLLLALATTVLFLALVPSEVRYNLNRGIFGPGESQLFGLPFLASALAGTAALMLWGQCLPPLRFVRCCPATRW